MSQKYVYLFEEGNANMRELLGGKGANLAEMTNIGMPVPYGFTITTEACTRYYDDGTCCMFPEDCNYDIGYCISKSHWKEGLGTEVIDAIIRWVKAQGGKSITGEVADINLASVALLRKFGFSEDRKTRYKKWGEETYFDAHYYKLNLE